MADARENLDAVIRAAGEGEAPAVGVTPIERHELECLKIRRKSDRRAIPFILNAPQRMLLDNFNRQTAARKPARVVLLKARQFGGSTFYVAVLYLLVKRYGCKAVIMGHNLEAANNLFDIFELLHRGDPDPAKPAIARRPEPRKWYFDNGGVIWGGTANSEDASRSGTTQAALITEAAMSQYSPDVFSALLNTVPRVPGSLVVVESTARGIGNDFHDLWVRAERGEGASRYEPLFVGWRQVEEYHTPFPAPEVREKFVLTLDSRERWQGETALAEEFGASPEQLLWRRLTIDDECKGDLTRFRQEYPSTPAEAFTVTGRPRFDTQALAAQYRDAPDEPEWTGEVRQRAQVDWTAVFDDPELFSKAFDKRFGGRLRVYSKPVRWDGEGRIVNYGLGADVAEGIEDPAGGTDDSAVTIMRRNPGLGGAAGQTVRPVEVLSWRGKIHPEDFADLIRALALAYNEAFCVVEANNHGLTTLTRLARQYPRDRIYRDPPARGRAHGRLGFYSTAVSRERVLSGFALALREEQITLRDRELIEELGAVAYDEHGRVSTTGRDRAISAVLAHEACAADVRRRIKPPGPDLDAQFRQRMSELAAEADLNHLMEMIKHG